MVLRTDPFSYGKDSESHLNWKPEKKNVRKIRRKRSTFQKDGPKFTLGKLESSSLLFSILLLRIKATPLTIAIFLKEFLFVAEVTITHRKMM